MNAQHTQSHSVWPNVNLPTDWWEDSVQILHVLVNVTVHSLLELIAKINVRKKEKSQHWVSQINSDVWGANAIVHLTTTILVRPSAHRKTRFTLQAPEAGSDVTFASVDAWTETVIRNVAILSSEWQKEVRAALWDVSVFVQMTVNQIVTGASQVTIYTFSDIIPCTRQSQCYNTMPYLVGVLVGFMDYRDPLGQRPPLGQRSPLHGKERAARILLECILVLELYSVSHNLWFSYYRFTLDWQFRSWTWHWKNK